MRRSIPWSWVSFVLLVSISAGACTRAPSSPADNESAIALPPPASEASTLEVVALANEGFLLRSGDERVLIDAFVGMPYAGSDALPKDVLAMLEAAEPPFDGVDLALVSHEHGDHVQPRPARRFLAASPETLLATSPQVITQIVEAAEADEAAAPSHEAHLPEPGATTMVERDGVHVEFLRLSHGARYASVQNLGHIITVGGQRVLHLGDAATEAHNFRPYALADRALDVALVPYWYFLESAGRRLVDEHLPARYVIACHIPSRERAEIAAKLAQTHPHVIVPAEPLQHWTIEPGRFRPRY